MKEYLLWHSKILPNNISNKINTVLTLGVGGRPLEVALGGEVARLFEEVRSLRRGGGWGEPEPFSLNTTKPGSKADAQGPCVMNVCDTLVCISCTCFT